MADVSSDDKKPARKDSLISNTTVEVIAGASSVVAGTATARSIVKGMAYKNMSSLGAVQDMKQERKRALQVIEDQIEHNGLTPDQAFKQVDKLIEENDRHAWNSFKKFGVKNFTDEWAILRRHQKVEALAFAFVTGGVALGALLPLMREWSRRDKAEGQPPQR